MIAFEIDQVKLFMSRLLLGDAFDHFLVPEVSITTYATFQIDGKLHPAFYADGSEAEGSAEAGGSAHDVHAGSGSVAGAAAKNAPYARWADLKDHCLAVIRGKHTPLAFHFVFLYPEEAAARLVTQENLPIAPEDVHGLYFNCRFQDNRLLVTSGTSLAVFDMQKAVERAWDAQLSRFLTKLELI